MGLDYPDVMIDLETVDVLPTSAILSIGAVKFNRKTKDIGPTFYRVIRLESCYEFGLTKDKETLKWWSEQSAEARRPFVQPGEELLTVLWNFKEFLGSKDHLLWGNGSDFDNTILANAYRQCRMEVPWNFRNNRCFRTVKDSFLIKTDSIFQGTKHNALDDAINQAKHLQELVALNSSLFQTIKYFLKQKFLTKN